RSGPGDVGRRPAGAEVRRAGDLARALQQEHVMRRVEQAGARAPGNLDAEPGEGGPVGGGGGADHAGPEEGWMRWLIPVSTASRPDRFRRASLAPGRRGPQSPGTDGGGPMRLAGLGLALLVAFPAGRLAAQGVVPPALAVPAMDARLRPPATPES